MKTIKLCLILFFTSCLISCGQISVDNPVGGDRHNTVFSNQSNGNLSEVAPPKIIKELNKDLEQYTPQVKIVSPQAEKTLAQTDISIQLEVKDLPIFQSEKLRLGNHLNLILDNEPYQQIYNLDNPVTLKNLTPGTHTVRVFAVRPWGESFKNEGAYAQTTFNVLTETNDNRTESNLPLLTYNNPTGIYGAEPLMLDFYLTNTPLHAIAQNDPSLKDWRIRATVNGVSFLLENWQPIYLTGFKQGENWIQLELVDEAGNDLENAFNNTVRVITYDPQREDALAQLVSNKISLADARSIVKPYYIQPVEEIVELDESRELKTASEPSVKVIEPQTKTIDSPSLDNTNEPSVTTVYPSETTDTSNPQIADSSDRQEPTTLDKTTKPEPEEPTGVINITEVNSDRQEPVATIKIPQPESVEITEAEIAITIPETETDNLSKSTPQTKTSLWWKKILVGLRQKIEGLAERLPDRV